MIRRNVAIAMGLLTALPISLATPVSAQTIEEAARTNLAVGAELCLRGGADMQAWVTLFRAAGFAETVDRSTINSDTTHTFSGPADTVTVELYYGETPEFCAARSPHVGVTAASDVLDRLVPLIHPGYLRQVTTGGIDPATGQPAVCVRYEDPASEIGLVIGVTTAAGCVPDGTSVIFRSYRV